jgi:phosphatidylglycerol:prolipoprotein diacylglycerol transferase
VLAFLDYTPITEIRLGPLAVSPHGIGTAFGFIAGAYLMLPAARRRGISDVQVWAMLTRAALGALIGARLAYVVNHLGDYIDRPLDALRVWEGGASLLGGIGGGILAALPILRRQRLDFWRVMDAAAPGLALGIAIGRIGDLVVADHLGKPTDFSLGYRCTGADTASPCGAPIGQAVHQPALYDLVSAVALLLFLLWLRRRPLRDGTLILAFAAWYGVGRVAQDFLRVDTTHGLFLTASQWAALAAATTAAVLLATGRRPVPWSRADEVADAALVAVGRVEPAGPRRQLP